MFDPQILNDLGICDWAYTETDEALTYDHFDSWVQKDHHLPLQYLTGDKKTKREKLSNYFPEFKSALVFLFSYKGEKKSLEEFYQSPLSNGLKIASYVFGFEGKDYHHVVRDRLKKISETLPENINFKYGLDTQPILDRDLAYKSGLGWFGKNSMFISKEHGSFFIIGSLLLDQKLDLPTRTIESDHCGTCTKCIDLCPTNAIDPQTRTLISSKCISTYTIELFKEAPPPKGYPNSGGEIFGCDICQDVCPWNERALLKTPEVPIKNENLIYFLKSPISSIRDYLQKLSNRGFRKEFKETPLERTGRVGLLKNINLF